MFNNSLYRLFLFIFCLIPVLLGYWFIGIVLVILGCVYYKNYYEIILFGLIYDSLFSLNSFHVGLLLCLAIFITIFYSKKIFIGYVNN